MREPQAPVAAVVESAGGAAHARPSKLRGQLISEAAEFATLATEWDALFERANSRNIFLSFGWMFTWWKHFGRGRLALVALRGADGALAAVAPLYITRSAAAAGGRRLGFLADERVASDYLDILCVSGYETAAAEEIAAVILAHQPLWDYIELCDTPESAAMTALSAEFQKQGMSILETGRRLCCYTALPDSFEEYLAARRASLRWNFRRRWRNLQRDHRAQCVAVSDTAAIEFHFPKLLVLHRMRFAHRHLESAFLAPGIPEFHADAARILAPRGFVRLFLLEAGGESIAAVYGFSVGSTFQFYQCGMHPGWTKYGPGQVLIGHAIDHSIAGRHAIFDFLRGGESYKARWANMANENVTLRFFDGRPSSAAARWSLRIGDAAHHAARDLKARLTTKPGPPARG